MSALRPLRGRCQCGRNEYYVAPPPDATELAQVLFNTEPLHQVPLATPLAAFLRVPLSWYRSTTTAFFPDESAASIRRTYTHPSQQAAKRHFCGYCGTPLSYWSEEPRGEAAYIQLTLGSLLGEDLRDLEELGLVPEPGTPPDAGADAEVLPAGTGATEITTTETRGVPWFDSLVEGTRLGTLRKSQGTGLSGDGRVRVEWEIVEWTEGDELPEESGQRLSPTKRKLGDVDAVDAEGDVDI